MRAWLPAMLLVATAAAAGPITIGPGPARGVDRAGVTWYEDFQDWTHADLRALDDAAPNDATFAFHDGLDDSRDLVALSARDEGGNLFFRVDVLDLVLGAENGGLDLYLALDAAAGGQVFLPDLLDCNTDRPWELCLAIYRSGTVQASDYRLFDAAFNQVAGAYLGVSYNSQLDAVEFGITRQALLNAGWDGVTPFTMQAFTTRDGNESNCTGGGRSSDLTDAIEDDDRGCSDGVLNGGTLSNASAGLVYYASIAHGNQSVNKAGDIGAHLYDSQASTGIAGGTGFLRTLDTHEIFRVPLNIHPSGTLTVACNWARRPAGATDPQDGPAFLSRVRDFVDADQSARPGALIGGVFAEHILPYFEGAVNAASLAFTDSLNRIVYDVGAAEAAVMHVPERVLRSLHTGLSPLHGRTFEDIAASPYTATYLDEVTHLHHWFYGGEACQPDASYRHKIHRINGVLCFMINDREDQAKFGNHDGGMVLDTRRSLLTKALYGGSSEMVVVFDDWEALAGKSFDPAQGISVPNDNPNRYHVTIRWAANHPWVRIATLRELLEVANANPGAFIVDHGMRFDLDMQTYEYLQHSSEDSYDNWYYNENAAQTGNEQDFYDLVPVITGPQGDYRARNATPAQDGPALPSGLRHGDLNTPGTLMYGAWNVLQTAPAGRLRDLGIGGYMAMIYETAWHEEDQTGYADTNCYGDWLSPDTSWDGVNTWALRLQNHVRQAGFYAAAAAWARDVRLGTQSPAVQTQAVDLDFDGEVEYLIRNDRVWAVFERYGGRCVLAAAYDPARQDGDVVIGAPYTNPSAPGEEEYATAAANRCSAFKEMNGGGLADAVYSVVAVTDGWRFTSPGGEVVKTMTLQAGGATLLAQYVEGVGGPLFVRLGLSPNPLDLALHGHAHLHGQFRATENVYILANTAGGVARLDCGSATFSPTPVNAGWDRRNLALTEEIEVHGDNSFTLALELRAGSPATSSAVSPASRRLEVSGPWPSPAGGDAVVRVHLAAAVVVQLEIHDVAGRRIAHREFGSRNAGAHDLAVTSRDASGRNLPSGVYWVRVRAGDRVATRRWTVVRP